MKNRVGEFFIDFRHVIKTNYSPYYPYQPMKLKKLKFINQIFNQSKTWNNRKIKNGIEKFLGRKFWTQNALWREGLRNNPQCFGSRALKNPRHIRGPVTLLSFTLFLQTFFCWNTLYLKFQFLRVHFLEQHYWFRTRSKPNPTFLHFELRFSARTKTTNAFGEFFS